jgi:cytochrome c-type biogenesis protein CcmE
MAYSGAMSQEGTARPRGIYWGWIATGLGVVVLSFMMFMQASDANVQYYMTVGEFLDRKDKYLGKKVKLAGIVEEGSLKISDQVHTFTVLDLERRIQVRFEGLVPDTFKEGVEVVVEGRPSQEELFVATSLMAKCASKYTEGGLPPLESMRGKSVY